LAESGESAEARLIHAGTERRLGSPATPPLVPASIFVSWGDPAGHLTYTRGDNPTWRALEEGLGALENADAVSFASGQAASMALMLTFAQSKRRILLARDGYYNTRGLAERLHPHAVEVTLVDLLDRGAVERELRAGPTVLWAETPTNPLLRVADLGRLAELAAAADAPMVVDNSVATALLQQPLELGAIASLYSLTKAASGHSDLVLGAVVSRDQGLLEELRGWRVMGGGIPGPFEAWLALRGLKTLPLRILRQSENALVIAEHLAADPRVRAVHYPGVAKEAVEIARRQMPRGFGPLLSFELNGDAAAADAVIAAARLIVPASSFGGIESSWERRARWASETAPDALIRLSVGVEPVSDLIADIDASLAATARTTPRAQSDRRHVG
jgi:cystathionine beta-lyase/cystathionine gamma-synthase